MVEGYGVPLAALIVSLATLLLSGLVFRRKADVSYSTETRTRLEAVKDDMRDVKKELAECERRHQLCDDERRQMQADLARLMRKLLDQEA